MGLQRRLGSAVFSLVTLLPVRARLVLYRYLSRIGRYIYGPTAPAVQKIPFGLVIKRTRSRNPIEAAACKIVARYTTIPVPHVFDWVISSSPHDKEWPEQYLVASLMPGKSLPPMSWLQLSDEEHKTYRLQLSAFLRQLRQIPPPKGYRISGADGGPCFDFRLHGECGPFQSEEAFDDFRISMAIPSARSGLRALVNATPRRVRDHRLCFTHGDLGPMNILVHQGSISGIIDWESAGWYPEYWEGVKGIYVWNFPEWVLLIRRYLMPGYEEENKLDYEMWRETAAI